METQYDFDEIIPRRHTSSVKWDSASDTDVLPMWVADMDFRTAQPILDALSRRVGHGILGYTLTPPAFFEAVTDWWQQRHGCSLSREWILPVGGGVIPALATIVAALTAPGDRIILQPPVYNHFFQTIENCGRVAAINALRYEDGHYSMDFDDLEQKASQPGTKLLLLCNPHNPVGRVWRPEDLERVAGICVKHGLLVVSDEIHADIVHEGYRHQPFVSLGEAARRCSVTCAAPTKTFNLAGLQVAYLVCPDPALKSRLELALRHRESELLSPFAVDGLIAAYRSGGPWLDAMKAYCYENYRTLTAFLAGQLPQLRATPLQATYLVWINVTALGLPAAEMAEALLREQKLWVNPGSLYGPGGDGFIRINIACPRRTLLEGLNRLKAHCDAQGARELRS